MEGRRVDFSDWETVQLGLGWSSNVDAVIALVPFLRFPAALERRSARVASKLA